MGLPMIPGEAPMPKAVAEHGDGSRPDAIIIKTEVSTERGTDAERSKKITGYHEAVDTFGLGAPGEVIIFVMVDRHRGKALAGTLAVEEIKVADGRLIHGQVFLVDGDELGRVGIRQRVEKHSVENHSSRIFWDHSNCSKHGGSNSGFGC
jgi:hypothetical protein